jgi:hypothetical protein
VSGVATPSDLFPLTLADVAERLEVSPEALAELVRLGELGAYLRPGEPGGPPPTFRFRDEDLADFARRQDVDGARFTALVAAALRDYLRAHQPHQPASDGDPVLAQDRGASVYAHIQLGAFQEWLRGRTATGDVRLYLTSTMQYALRRLGCRPMRGIRPLHAPGQVWAAWWRIPFALWSLSVDELAPLREEVPR